MSELAELAITRNGVSFRVFQLIDVGILDVDAAQYSDSSLKAIFSKLEESGENEWALWGILHTGESDPPLREQVETAADKIAAMESAGLERTFMRKRAILYGMTIGEIAKDPLTAAAGHHRIFSALQQTTELMRDVLLSITDDRLREIRYTHPEESERSG